MPSIVKITDLVELTNPADGDLITIVDISEPLDINKTKKITFSKLIAGKFSAAGDIFYATAANVLAVLAKPSTESVLKMTYAGVPSWKSLAEIVQTLIYGRQGGSSTNWNTSGTTNYTPSAGNIKFQAGAKSLSIATPNYTVYTLITFPVPFTNKPIVLVSGGSGTGTGVFSCGVDVDTITNTGFYLRFSVYPSGNFEQTLNWLAIGE